MLGATKPLASLTPGLLARKGQARPAMRPPVLPAAPVEDDLGWNDMGEGDPASPPVLRARAALVQDVAAAFVPPVSDISVATAARIRRETTHRRTAAFTLRLDEDRHLRLRLASATRNLSAQRIVTAALDAFIATLPEVETLVGQLAPRRQRPPATGKSKAGKAT